MSNKITTQWQGKRLFESDNPSGHTILMDIAKENGGNSVGLRPKAMMLSSLAGCSGLDVVSLLEKMKIDVDDFKMEVEGELTEEHPKYYHKVSLEYHFYGSNLNEAKITKAVNLSVDKYCGVMEMFRQFAKVNTSIHIHNN
jgi:putative redox protein